MSRHPKRPARQPIVFEPLEERVLLSADCPVIELIEGDNRGLIALTSSLQLRASTVNEQNIRMFAAGNDALIGTDDDVQVDVDVSWDNATRRILIDGDVPADQRYRIIVDGDAIVSTDGVALDAEFNGFGQDTGDGVAGGTLDIYSRSTDTPIARLVTAFGNIDIELFEDETPLTVANFLRYANDGLYDQSFFHRLVENFVIQGGGFFSNADLDEIPKFGTVLNEPGISNTRGTIAMAKMAGNPNSATSEWFFNLGNNSANLDNQNGGFTVFGRIADSAGFDVLDELADLMMVDASSQGSPFGELPVLSVEDFENAGDMAEPDNLIAFERISLLVEFDNEPFQQLDLEGSMAISNPEGDATVTFVDVSGSGMLTGSDMFDVKFGKNNTIKSITLSKDMPDVPIGIVISDTDEVGSLKDKRSGTPADVSYIISSAQINKISLKSGITGMDLNNVIAPGIIFSDDIDGDSRRDDPLAVFVEGGFVQSISIKGDITGDIVAMNGVGKISIKGDLNNGDFTIGAADRDRATVSIDAERINNSSVRSQMPVGTISVTDWRDTGAIRNEIEAPSVKSIRTSGSRDVEGDFDVNLDIAGDGDTQPDLGSVSIKGDIFSGDWSVGGDVGAVKVGGDALNWYVDIGGDLQSVDFGEGANVNIIVEGELRSNVKVDTWNGGTLEADRMRSVNVRNDANIDITVNNVSQEDFNSASFSFGGDFAGSIAVLGGARNVTVKGDVDDAELRFADEVRNMQLGRITDSTIEILNGARKLTFIDWNGGELRGDQYRRIEARGANGVPGDIRADLSLGQFIMLHTRRGGDLETDASIQAAGLLDIAGDIVDSEINITGGNAFFPTSLQQLIVGGSLLRTNIHTTGNIDMVEMRGMFDSVLISGGPTSLFSLPSSASGFNTFATLPSVNITGVGQNVSFQNSVIAARFLGDIAIAMPDTTNGGIPFGIAGATIDSVTITFAENDIETIDPVTTSVAFDDFEIRANFAVPA